MSHTPTDPLDASPPPPAEAGEEARRLLGEAAGIPVESDEEICLRDGDGRVWVDAALRAIQSALARQPEPAREVGEALLEAVKPWASYHGDLPDYDHPLRCVFESGVQYAVELLAKELDVKDWEACDGTEEFDGDLGGTMMNIVMAALPTDEHGDPLRPSEICERLSAGEVERLREALKRIDKFITDFRAPWGSWKTAWWEGEVSDDAAFSADNATMHVANIARAALGGRDD